MLSIKRQGTKGICILAGLVDTLYNMYSEIDNIMLLIDYRNKEDQNLAINQYETLKNYAESVLSMSKTEVMPQASTGKAK